MSYEAMRLCSFALSEVSKDLSLRIHADTTVPFRCGGLKAAEQLSTNGPMGQAARALGPGPLVPGPMAHWPLVHWSWGQWDNAMAQWRMAAWRMCLANAPMRLRLLGDPPTREIH